MAKKIEINENWEPVEVEDLSNLFVVLFKQGSFDQGYIEAFDTDDVLMQSAYDNLAKQYGDCGCDECTKIYLIKLPNTEQVQGMLLKPLVIYSIERTANKFLVGLVVVSQKIRKRKKFALLHTVALLTQL